MKKSIICLIALFIVISCTKENTLCGCSPIRYDFTLNIANQQSADLLAPATPGAYSHSALKIKYRHEGLLKDAGATVFPPFSFSASNQMPYYSVGSIMGDLAVAGNFKEFYLDFGNGDIDTITLDSYNTSLFEPINLKINNKLLVKNPNVPKGYRPFYTIVK